MSIIEPHPPEPSAPRPRVIGRSQAMRHESVRVGLASGQAADAGPRVELRHGSDGQVTAIVVHCSCGETLQVLCHYGEPSS